METDLQEYTGLVKGIALTQNVPSHMDQDNLVQAGWVGMLKAVRDYDPSQGPLRPYAAHRIRGEVLDEMRHQDPLKRAHRAAIKCDESPDIHHVPLDKMSDPDYLAYTAPDDSANVEAFVLARERAAVAQRLIQRCMSALPERLQTVVQKYWLDGKRMKAVGAEMGINESRVSQLNSNALYLMRQAMTVGDAALAADVMC